MTVPEVLQRYGIARQKDLAERLGIHHQQAQLIWSGKVGLGRKMLLRLVEQGIPAGELLEAHGGAAIYRKRDTQPA